MNRALVLLPALAAGVLLAAGAAAAKGPPVLRYKAPGGGADERPVATEVSVTAQGGDFFLRLVFDRSPFGEGCKTRCANTTIYIDTDDKRATGLQAGDKSAATGADLAVTVQGVRDWGEQGAKDQLKVRVRLLTAEAKSLETGEAVADLDNIRDAERLTVEDGVVTVLVDASVADLPAAKKARVVYHPPGTKALTMTVPGMLAPSRGGRGVDVMRGKGR